MKTNELRINNYVNIEGDVVKVKEIYEKGIHYANSEYESYATEDFIQPIELTGEVLKKIVGVKVVDLDYNKTRLIGTNYHFNDCMVSLIYEGNKYQTKLISSKYKISLNVKHLHELQNAYYCLTGQELNIEL